MEVIRKLINNTFRLNISKHVYWQFIKFAFVGAFCATIEFSLFSFMVTYFGDKNYMYFNATAFTNAVIINYLISRSWIFERGRYSGNVEFLVFLLVAVIALGLNQTVLYVAFSLLHWNLYLSKVLSILLVVVWNFTAKKFFVFKG